MPMPIPATKRSAISEAMLPASAVSPVMIVYQAIPAISTRLRP